MVTGGLSKAAFSKRSRQFSMYSLTAFVALAFLECTSGAPEGPFPTLSERLLSDARKDTLQQLFV